MTSDELKKYLEDLQMRGSGSEVFNKIFDMLRQRPFDHEATELLETWLMGYAFHPDCDHNQLNAVALYWKPFLYGETFLLKQNQ